LENNNDVVTSEVKIISQEELKLLQELLEEDLYPTSPVSL
jgi:hypothetical protein